MSDSLEESFRKVDWTAHELLDAAYITDVWDTALLNLLRTFTNQGLPRPPMKAMVWHWYDPFEVVVDWRKW